MKKLLARFVSETDGQDLIEYALLGTLIGLACITAVGAFQATVSTVFANIGTSVTGGS